MSYAQAKEIALLRFELRACSERHDREGAEPLLQRMSLAAGNDNELSAEIRRWYIKFRY